MSTVVPMVSVVWAERVARELLEPVDTRWPHVRRAAQQARIVCSVVEPGDRGLLVAARPALAAAVDRTLARLDEEEEP